MMPSEPDKKIEELLRTYARKRREDAGEPLELHPATRRLLQAEAAKLRPPEETPQRTLWSWLVLRWPRVAFAAAIVAVLAIAFWNGMPDRSQSSSPALLAKRDQEAESLSKTRPAARNGMVAPSAPQDSLAEQDKDFAKRALPEALPPTPRSLDEYRTESLLGDRVTQADTKLKEESASLGAVLQPTPASGLKNAEKQVAAGTIENQVLVRKLQADQPAPQVARREAAGRFDSVVTNALPSQSPDADARGKQAGFADSIADGATSAGRY